MKLLIFFHKFPFEAMSLSSLDCCRLADPLDHIPNIMLLSFLDFLLDLMLCLLLNLVHAPPVVLHAYGGRIVLILHWTGGAGLVDGGAQR